MNASVQLYELLHSQAHRGARLASDHFEPEPARPPLFDEEFARFAWDNFGSRMWVAWNGWGGYYSALLEGREMNPDPEGDDYHITTQFVCDLVDATMRPMKLTEMGRIQDLVVSLYQGDTALDRIARLELNKVARAKEKKEMEEARAYEVAEEMTRTVGRGGSLERMAGRDKIYSFNEELPCPAPVSSPS